MIPTLGDGTLWWKLASIIYLRNTRPARSLPELVKVFTSTKSSHVKEVVKSAQEGGASAGNPVGIRGRQFLRLLGWD